MGQTALLSFLSFSERIGMVFLLWYALYKNGLLLLLFIVKSSQFTALQKLNFGKGVIILNFSRHPNCIIVHKEMVTET